MAIEGQFCVLRVEIIEKGIIMAYIYVNNKNKKLYGSVAPYSMHFKPPRPLSNCAATP